MRLPNKIIKWYAGILIRIEEKTFFRNNIFCFAMQRKHWLIRLFLGQILFYYGTRRHFVFHRLFVFLQSRVSQFLPWSGPWTKWCNKRWRNENMAGTGVFNSSPFGLKRCHHVDKYEIVILNSIPVMRHATKGKFVSNHRKSLQQYIFYLKYLWNFEIWQASFKIMSGIK